jgi:hypothetical protein
MGALQVNSKRAKAVSTWRVRPMVYVISFALLAGACTVGRAPASHRQSLPPITRSIDANVLGCSFAQGSATIRVSFDTTLEPSTGDVTFELAGGPLQAVMPSGLTDLRGGAMTPPSKAWTEFTVPTRSNGSDLDVIEFNTLFLSVHADEHERARSPSGLIGREFRVPGGLTASVLDVQQLQGSLGVGLLFPSVDIEPGVNVYGATGTLTIDGETFRSSEFGSPIHGDGGMVTPLLFDGVTGNGETDLSITGWSIAVERGPRIALSDCP